MTPISQVYWLQKHIFLNKNVIPSHGVYYFQQVLLKTILNRNYTDYK